MSHFEAAHAPHELGARGARLAAAGRVAPMAAAISAVFAALATLLANHTSVSSLAQKNEAVLYQSKASDQYNLYEAGRSRAQVDRSLLDAGLVGSSGRALAQARIDKENANAQPALARAQSLEAQSEQHFAASEKHLGAYASYEIAATLFQVCVVLMSIASLVRVKAIMLVAAAGMLAGLGFLAWGFVR
jgi:hypothetical protein